MIRIIKSLIFEYGIMWSVNRSLYALKIKLLKMIPATAVMFEKAVNINRIDLFCIDISELKGFLESLPQEKCRQIVKIADDAIAGKIKAFSSVELEYGNPIDWQLNPITGGHTSIKEKWYTIPDFDSLRGDIKVIWEPSRLTHFFYFARAYLLTSDKKYYEAFSSQLEQWLDENPYSYGANFKCGQECALRMINVLLVTPVFSDLLTNKNKENIKKLIEVCYKKIRSNFFYAQKCIKNNHTFSEIAGLIAGAWCCENDVNLHKAYQLLEKEIENQFEPDGGYTQYSFNYQRFVLHIFNAIFKMERKTGVGLSCKSKERLKKSVILLYQMQQSNGFLPNYGSNDGALIFPLSVCDYRDFRPCLNTLYSLITGNRIYSRGEYDEELYWFGEPKLPIIDIARQSSAFDEAGLYVMRSDVLFAMIACQSYKSRPAHFDQLHIDLWYKGINVFCDSGTYSYASDLGMSLAKTIGHNVVVADGREQMSKKGAFFVYDWTKRIDAKLKSNTFSGTFSSQNGYKHKRTVKLTEVTCEIIDEVIGANIIERLFHTPCDVEINNGGFCLKHKDKYICQILCDGEISVVKSKRSCYYMKYEDINLISVKTDAMDMQTINIYFTDSGMNY